jgi:multisubunit Na+/H+ antiporter MnhC subunit
MNAFEMPWLSPLNTTLCMLLFVLGLYCLLTQRKVIKQVIGLKIMLQGVTLGLIHAGHLVGTRASGGSLAGDTVDNASLRLAEAMVISALIVEAVVIALALAMIVNVYRHYPSGDIDQLDTLQG